MGFIVHPFTGDGHENLKAYRGSRHFSGRRRSDRRCARVAELRLLRRPGLLRPGLLITLVANNIGGADGGAEPKTCQISAEKSRARPASPRQHGCWHRRKRRAEIPHKYHYLAGNGGFPSWASLIRFENRFALIYSCFQLIAKLTVMRGVPRHQTNDVVVGAKFGLR